jgi:hypothetical protein
MARDKTRREYIHVGSLPPSLAADGLESGHGSHTLITCRLSPFFQWRSVVAQSAREGFPGPSAATDGCSDPPGRVYGVSRKALSYILGDNLRTPEKNKKGKEHRPFPFSITCSQRTA